MLAFSMHLAFMRVNNCTCKSFYRNISTTELMLYTNVLHDCSRLNSNLTFVFTSENEEKCRIKC